MGFGPSETIVILAMPRLLIFSLIDGQQEAAIAIPGGIDTCHDVQCVWPNYLVLSTSMKLSEDTDDAGMDQRLFIYDFTKIQTVKATRAKPIMVTKPHYKLIYPRQMSDFPPHISERLEETYPVHHFVIWADWVGTYHKNGIIQLSVCVARHTGLLPKTKHHISIYIDLDRLLKSLSPSNRMRTIPLKKWYPFSYFHLEEAGEKEVSGFGRATVPSSKMFTWKRPLPSDEITVYCHDMNQRLVNFSGQVGSDPGGGRDKVKVVQQDDRDDAKNTSDFTDLTITHSKPTSQALGAITRKAVCQLSKNDKSQPTLLFDGQRLYLQNEPLITEAMDRHVDIYDFR